MGAIESKTTYFLLVNLLLPILLELQKGDILTIRVHRGLDGRCKPGWHVNKAGLLCHYEKAYILPNGAICAKIIKICYNS